MSQTKSINVKIVHAEFDLPIRKPFGKKNNHYLMLFYCTLDKAKVSFHNTWLRLIAPDCALYLYTVLPRLVRMRMRDIKLMSFSGFILTERAYYSRRRTKQLIASWPISQIYFLHLFIQNLPILSIFLNFLIFLWRETLIWNSCKTDRLS